MKTISENCEIRMLTDDELEQTAGGLAWFIPLAGVVATVAVATVVHSYWSGRDKANRDNQMGRSCPAP